MCHTSYAIGQIAGLHMRIFHKLTTSLCILLLSACSFHSVKHNYDKPLSQCQKQLTQKISQLKKTGILDTQDHFIQGFEFLAVDRFLAQLYTQASNKIQRQEWLKLAFNKAQIKSLVSLQNQGNDPYELAAFEFCNQQLYKNLLENPALLWSQVDAQQIMPKNNYSTLSRFLGGYWIAQWLAKPSIQKEKNKAISLWQQTISTAEKATTWELEINGKEESSKRQFKPKYADVYGDSPLQIPIFLKSNLQELFKLHAPQWKVLINDHSTYQSNKAINTPGTPYFKNAWFINTNEATVFTHSSFTFFNDKKLLQLNYLMWFPQASYSQTGTDWYGGKFDGVYWRVTLDTDGEVLLYDSIHACGCYHTVIINPKKLVWIETDKSDPPIKAPTSWVTGPVQVTLSANQHWLIGLSNQKNADHSFSLKPLNQLRSVQTPQGFKSLYNQKGFIKGSERGERFFLWPFGVNNAGAMRQWGQHATAFIGKRHFDDANWLDDFFKRK